MIEDEENEKLFEDEDFDDLFGEEFGEAEIPEQEAFDEVFEDGDFELIERTIDEDGKEKSWVAEETIEVIAKENTGKNIIVHCFSNNGFNFYKHVSQLLKEKPQG